MNGNDMRRRLAAECVGTAFLLATVIGSGIMAERLSGGNVGLALLANAIATGAILVVLITALGPVSGAHFNPAVTLAFLVRGKITLVAAGLYLLVQVIGAIGGAMAAHAMFELPLLQVSQHARAGPAQWFSEGVATFGLVAAIIAGARWRPDAVAWMVGLYITAAYWFTASTSFANPAVTVARILTDTFSGIRPMDAPAFIVAQCVAGVLAAWALGWLLHPKGYPQAGAGRQRDAAAPDS